MIKRKRNLQGGSVILIDKEQVAKAKAKLGDANAEIIANLLHVENYDEVNKKGLCPYHLENTPSFIYNPKTYSFHCFGCSRNADIIDAYMNSGQTYLEAVDSLFKETGIPLALGEKGVRTKTQYKYPRLEPLNAKENVYRYLEQRCISKEVVDNADVREDSHGNIVFNYYDTNDVLTLVKYRPSHKIDKARGDIKAWCQKDADTTPLLFNMNRVNINAPLLITEGEIDCLAAIQAGYTNAVSVPLGANNYSWIEENFDWLEQFDQIIICSDNDEAGQKMQKECVYRLGSWRTKYIEIPKFCIDMETGEQIPMKDLNHVLYYQGAQEVMDLIIHAKDMGVPSVSDMSDIEDIDLDQLDGIVTGIKSLDYELMKLYYGTLTVVTGLPGSGKTSFLDQLVCHCLEQDNNAWVFSREMPGWMTKSWINYILSGRQHIKEYTDNNGCPFYKVTLEAKKKINEFYRGKWFVYKDDESNKFEDLLVSMTDSVRKYGTKLLILDNLMTIDLNSTEDNEMLKQTEAINKLISFAMKYNVAVVLVAHPRKMPRDTEVGMYDVSGTANIANLAHRTMSLKRVDHEKETSNFDVELTIIKDRMRGRLNKKIGLFYDIPSRRFYSNPKEFNFQYRWDEGRYNPIEYPHPEEQEVFGTIREEAEEKSA